MALPSSVLYTMPPESVPSQMRTTDFLASNGSENVAASSQIKIEIAGNRGEYLDTTNSLLKFTVHNPSGTDHIAASGHASCFIERVDVYFQNTLVESISDYNVLFAALYDASVSPTQRSSGDAILAGTSPSQFDRTGQSIGVNAHQGFMIPMLGIMGAHCSKYLPLGYGSFRIEITLASAVSAVTSINTVAWTVSDTNYQASITKLDSAAQMQVEASLPDGRFQIHSSSFRGYNGQITQTGTSSEANIYVPASFASLKRFIVAQRYTSKLSVSTENSISNRTTNGIKSFYFRAGSTNLPQTPVAGVEESFAELCKAKHALSSGDYNFSMSKSTYELEDHATTLGAYLQMLDAESFSGKSGVLMSGIDTTNSPVYYIAKYTPANAVALTLNIFCEFDQILEIDINSNSGLTRF